MKILVKISGSIAAYKICTVVSQLVKDGHEVKVAASKSALQFVGAATWEALSGAEIYEDDFKAGRRLDHIYLNDWADLCVLAPATAQTLNSLASGVGSSVLTTLFLARKKETPYLIFPAMNPRMWGASSLEKSLGVLEQQEGVHLFSPSTGEMACGHQGVGRLLEPHEILDKIYSFFHRKEKILITLGGTSESIDGVRELTNFSTGRTGLEFFKSMRSHFQVDLLASKKTGPLFSEEFGGNVIFFTDVDDLESKMKSLLEKNHYTKVFHLAAVSDFKVKNKMQSKLDSSDALQIEFVKAPKILNSIRSWSLNKNVELVSFKLTHEQAPDHIEKKIINQFEKSQSNFIVHNNLNDISSTSHKFFIFDSRMKVVKTGHSKSELIQFFNTRSV